MMSKKLENYIIAILFIGLVILIVWKFDIVGILSERKEEGEIEAKIEAWTRTAKENLKKDFVFMEGENHFFVKGSLVSECIELDPDSHCPVSMSKAKINDDKLFVSDFRFAVPTSPDIYPYPVNENINVLGFLGKNHDDSINLEFEILDYIPNTTLCKTPHDKQELCNINWTKKIVLDKPISAEILLVKISDFDYSFLNKTLKVFLKGEIENDEIPNVTLAVYRDSGLRKSLLNKNSLDLQDKNGSYVFEFDGSFKLSRPERSHSILLLFNGENSFYAKEWIFEDGEEADTTVYD